MKTEKDLHIPFTWEERRPIVLDRFFYIPAVYDYQPIKISYFEENLPIIIEYCSGNGQWIGERAKQNPQFNWIGVEKKFVRARQIWKTVHREQLKNLFVVCGEASVFTRFYAPLVKEIFVNFPDPWPKARHAKHRLIQSPFLEELSQIVIQNGTATCVTDDSGYALEMQKEFEKCPCWQLRSYGHDWPDYGASFFGQLWVQKKRLIHYLTYERL